MDALYKLEKTPEDIELLLKEHKNLVYYVLTQYGQLRNQDAESAAWEALWDAIMTFDVFSQNAFSTYACVVIRNAIFNVLKKQLLIREKDRVIFDELKKKPKSYNVVYYDQSLYRAEINSAFVDFITNATEKRAKIATFFRASGYCATVTEIADYSGCTPSYVSRVLRDFRAHVAKYLKKE